MFRFKVNKVGVKIIESEILTSGSRNIYQCRFEFNPDWNDLDKTAVFRSRGVVRSTILDSDNICQIPWEVLLEPSMKLEAGVYGTKNGQVVMPTVWSDIGKVQGGAVLGEPETPPPTNVYDQVLSKANEAAEIARMLRADAESGAFDGPAGSPGTPGLPPKIGPDGYWYVYDNDAGDYVKTDTFAGGDAPYIGANGNWFIGSGDTGVSAMGQEGKPGKDGAQGPAGKDGYTPVKGVDYFDGKDGSPGADGTPGPAGEPGHTPVKGVDYWTQEDIEELLSYGLLPTFVDSMEEMTDQTKHYVLTTDGFIYAYGTKTTVHTGEEFFQSSGYELNKRQSTSSVSDMNGYVLSGMIPVDMNTVSPYILRVQGLTPEQMANATASNNRIGYYNADGVQVGQNYFNYPEVSGRTLAVEKDGEDYLIKIDTPASSVVSSAEIPDGNAVTQVRICFGINNTQTPITDADVSGIRILREADTIIETVTGWHSTGLSYTPVKGEDYFTEADKEEIVQEVLASMPEPEAVNSDWNQNDPDGPGYVQNRPGGYRIESSTELVNGDYTFTLGSSGAGYVNDEIKKSLVLKEGKEYKVVIDGIEHTLTATKNPNSPYMFEIGDINTKEPCYYMYSTTGLKSPFQLPNPNNETGSKVVHIEIYTDVVSEYVKFPREAIPDILPEVTAEDVGKFLRVSSDGEWGPEAIEVLNGEDGVSPAVSITEITGGHRITITDAEGTKTADVMDGAQGPKGDTGAQGIQGETGPKGDTGATGPAGADGYTPVKGTDYWTEADKTEMVNEVLAALPTWTGGNY